MNVPRVLLELDRFKGKGANPIQSRFDGVTGYACVITDEEVDIASRSSLNVLVVGYQVIALVLGVHAIIALRCLIPCVMGEQIPC